MAETTVLNQFLTFLVNQETYAVSVGHIREVLEFQSPSVVPRMPDYMRGIINLRGSVVPVIDLKMKFGLGETEKTVDASVIVSEIELEGKEIILGLLTDAVSEVIEIAPEEIEPSPSIGTAIDSSFIEGMGKKGEDFFVILNINKVLTSGEIAEIASGEPGQT